MPLFFIQQINQERERYKLIMREKKNQVREKSKLKRIRLPLYAIGTVFKTLKVTTLKTVSKANLNMAVLGNPNPDPDPDPDPDSDPDPNSNRARCMPCRDSRRTPCPRRN